MSEPKEPLILAIETATRAGSVALTKGRQIVSSTSGDASVSHSTDLIQAIEEALTGGGVRLSDIDLFAAAVGPGSFTGLRIGLATIKSFAVCTERSCAGISTLAAIAHAAGAAESTVSLLPAGRGELFVQMFAVDEDQVRELDAAAHLSPPAVLEKYGAGSEIVWAGEGAHQYAEILRAGANVRNRSFDESTRTRTGWSLAPLKDQLATSIAALALNAYHDGSTVDPNQLRAVYVRASDAEINEKCTK
jgi:tRNA threonylcarbamoyladenosine biosynthesis protein TsaB